MNAQTCSLPAEIALTPVGASAADGVLRSVVCWSSGFGLPRLPARVAPGRLALMLAELDASGGRCFRPAATLHSEAEQDGRHENFDMFPKQAVASVTGIGGLAGATAGMAFPILTGRLLDTFEAGGNVTGGYAVLFMICSGMYLFAFAVHHLCAPRFEPFPLSKAWAAEVGSPAPPE